MRTQGEDHHFDQHVDIRNSKDTVDSFGLFTASDSLIARPHLIIHKILHYPM
jgi:hypothetical protein